MTNRAAEKAMHKKPPPISGKNFGGKFSISICSNQQPLPPSLLPQSEKKPFLLVFIGRGKGGNGKLKKRRDHSLGRVCESLKHYLTKQRQHPAAAPRGKRERGEGSGGGRLIMASGLSLGREREEGWKELYYPTNVGWVVVQSTNFPSDFYFKVNIVTLVSVMSDSYFSVFAMGVWGGGRYLAVFL